MLRRVESYLKLSILFACVSSGAFLLIPIRNLLGAGVQKAATVLIALLFWGGLLLEQYFFWTANAGRKKIRKKAFGGRKLVKSKIGLITFFSNREAGICDLTFFFAAVLTVLFVLVKIQNDWLVMPALGALLLSFHLHCIFNGVTYRYIKAFQKIKKEPKRHENTNNIS